MPGRGWAMHSHGKGRHLLRLGNGGSAWRLKKSFTLKGDLESLIAFLIFNMPGLYAKGIE